VQSAVQQTGESGCEQGTESRRLCARERNVEDLTFITVAGPATSWDCDLRIRLVVGADLCTRRGLVDCGCGVGGKYAVGTAMDAAIAGSPSPYSRGSRGPVGGVPAFDRERSKPVGVWMVCVKRRQGV
jgi:hypothetical protein